MTRPETTSIPLPMPPMREQEVALNESEKQCRDMLYAALWSKTGWLWQCSDPDTMINRLQRLRRKLADPDLMTLHIWRSRIADGDIMIAHGKRYSEIDPPIAPTTDLPKGIDLDLKEGA